jgi:PAS domain S-box-containing protein
LTSAPLVKFSRESRELLFQHGPGLSGGLFAAPQKDQAQNLSVEPGEDSDKFLRAVVDACASNVAVLDESGNILYASKAWHLFEKLNSPVSRQHDRSLNYFENYRRFEEPSFGDDTTTTLSDDIQRILVGDEKEFHRRYCYYKLNSARYLFTHAARLDLPGSAFRVLVNHDDVVVAREALQKSEERLSQLLETTKILVWEAEPASWRFTYVSKQAVEMLGYSIAQWYKSGFLLSHIHRNDEQRALSFCQKHPHPADHHDLTFRMLARDGRVVWVQNIISVTHENGKPIKMHGFMVDISERKRAEEALQELTGRLVAAQEEERSRVARELHDDLSQKMALASIELGKLAQATHKTVSLRSRFRKLTKQVNEISNDIHRLSYRLHPSKLDHLGLAAAVKGLCKQPSERSNLNIELKQTGFPATLSNEVTLCAFRVVQESLRNCVKHSGAQTVQVVLEKTDDVLRISISDDGCGFDTKSDAMTKGLGFVSMKERLHLVGGQIQIHSHPMRGTSLTVSIPLVRESDPGKVSKVTVSGLAQQDPLALSFE